VSFPTQTAATPAPANPSREKIAGSSHHHGTAKRLPVIPQALSPRILLIIFHRVVVLDRRFN
jgi:hypothetical protein